MNVRSVRATITKCPNKSLTFSSNVSNNIFKIDLFFQCSIFKYVIQYEGNTLRKKMPYEVGQHTIKLTPLLDTHVHCSPETNANTDVIYGEL